MRERSLVTTTKKKVSRGQIDDKLEIVENEEKKERKQYEKDK